MTNVKVIGTNEILSAMLSYDVRGNLEHLRANPRDYIAETYGVDLALDMAIVKNSATEIHLSLPYYSESADMYVDTLSEEDIASISGGEWVVLGILLAVGLPAVTVAAIGGGVHAHYVRNPK